MPQIGTQSVPLFLDPLPLSPERPAEILTRPGMAAASVLFGPARYQPVVIRTVCSASSKAKALVLSDKFKAMVTSRLTFDDGITSLPGCVILRADSVVSDAGIIIGGNASSDRWEVLTTWRILPDADLETR